MNSLGLLSFAVLGLIAFCLAPSTSASVIQYPESFLADQQQDQIREKRSPQLALSGGGSNKEGSIRIQDQRNVWSNGKTGVDVNGFAQRSWQPDTRPQNSFGAGAEVSHNLYKGKHGNLDAYVNYQRQWNTPNKHNANAGIRYTF